MKRIFKLSIALIAVVLVAGAGIFWACQKEKIEKMDFTEIDKVSSDIADFHTYAMTKILNNPHLYEDAESKNSIDKLNDFIIKEMLNYDFKYLKIEANTTPSSYIFDYSAYKEIASIVEKGYDFSKISNAVNTTNSKSISAAARTNTELVVVNNTVPTPSYNLIERKCQNIENKMSSLVTIYNDFGQLQTAYLKFVAEELKDVTFINDYTYLRYYADVYISSFEYWVNYYSGTKGKLGDIWNKVKVGVGVDAAGAIGGAIGGAVGGAVVGSLAGGVGAGPGAAVGAVGGAISCGIGASATYAITNLTRLGATN